MLVRSVCGMLGFHSFLVTAPNTEDDDHILLPLLNLIFFVMIQAEVCDVLVCRLWLQGVALRFIGGVRRSELRDSCRDKAAQ